MQKENFWCVGYLVNLKMDLSCNETINLKEVENDECENSKKYGYETDTGRQQQQETHLYHQPPPVQQQIQPQRQTVQVTKKNPVITKLYFDACEDPTFLKDRCLENLLISEKRYPTPSTYYFNSIQRNLTPNMRRMVAEWTIEVSFSCFCYIFIVFYVLIQLFYCNPYIFGLFF